MADNSISRIFIFVKEISYARKRNLIDILVDFLCGHSYTTVTNCQGSFICI